MKNKRIPGSLLVLLGIGMAAASMSLTVSASDVSGGTCGDALTWSLSDGILTISGSGDMYDYDRYETPWNLSASVIRKVVTGDEVTRIGTNAFYGCESLTEVVLGRGTASVGEFAFRECSALQTLTPGDATQTVDSAFFDTDLLTVLCLRSSVTELSDTFRDMDTLTTFLVDDTDGTGFYTSGDTLYYRETIDGEEIKTLVKYPEGKLLTGTFLPEDNTDIIGDNAFYQQEQLEAVILPECTYQIEEFAFRECSALYSFTPGDATRTIDSAFYDTDSLSVIFLRNTVTELSDAIRDLPTVLEFRAEDTDGVGFYDINGVLYHYDIQEDQTVKTLVKCPEGNKLSGTYTVESGTSVIGEKAFYEQNLLEAVSLPETVQKLSSHAFYGCNTLNGVYFYGNPLAFLPKNTFQNCSPDLILYYIEENDEWTDPWKTYDTEPFYAKTPLKGDINGDAVLDDNDAQIFLRYFAGWQKRFSAYLEAFPKPEDFLDFNNDGVFNIKDRMLLRRYLDGWKDYIQYFE